MIHPLLRKLSMFLGTIISLAVFLVTLAFTDTGQTTVEEAALERTVTHYSKQAEEMPGNADAISPSGERTPEAVLRVIDGDTIELASGERVRYIGIDTPESVDPRRQVECLGKEAAERNRELVGNRVVLLESDIEERDKYGRLLRYVYLEDGTMVNETLVREGYADPATFPPNIRHVDRFLAAATLAREEKRGLWGAICTDASDTVTASEPTTAPDGCVIKGNISSSGERIFHAPECPYYSRTRIDSARGERYFCTETDAEADGFRRAGNCPDAALTPPTL
ncbi:MAG TPA: thermonuclease family protein [Candidatus Paceibacterota bacterium]|nr:thermonuclease family protein [Candidatus Paceibacterota bacterium]